MSPFLFYVKLQKIENIVKNDIILIGFEKLVKMYKRL